MDYGACTRWHRQVKMSVVTCKVVCGVEFLMLGTAASRPLTRNETKGNTR